MLTRAGKLAIADAGFAGLTIPRIGIFTNDFNPDEFSVYADFTLAVYTGYSNATVVLSPVFVTQSGKVSSDVGDATFLGPTAGAGVDAYGWFLFDNVTHDVWACGRFDPAPQSLQNLMDRLQVDEQLHIDGTDDSTVEN